MACPRCRCPVCTLLTSKCFYFYEYKACYFKINTRYPPTHLTIYYIMSYWKYISSSYLAGNNNFLKGCKQDSMVTHGTLWILFPYLELSLYQENDVIFV